MRSLDVGTDCVYWFDATSRIVFANAAARRTLGYSREELARMTVADISPTEPTEDDGLDAMRCYETVHRRKDGRLVPVEVFAAPVVIGDRRFVAAAVRDLSLRPRADHGESRRTAEEGESNVADAAAAPPRVLVVEDSRTNQRVVREMLKRLGIVVEVANNGIQAVAAMRRGPDRFDAILMDIQMPEMDGLEATRVIRREFPHRAVPIIAATANDLESERAACLAVGMNDCVSKPIEPKQLEATLARWVRTPSTAPAAGPSGRPPQAHPPMLAWLRGVDIGSALARLDGKPDLFVRLLRDFVEEYETAAVTIAAAIAHDDLDAAIRLAHDLKGVAGTLSASAVYEAARALEASLRRGQRAALPARVERLSAALDVVCRSVAEWARDAAQAPAPSERLVPAPSAAAAALAEFDRLLKDRRFAARQQFATVREHASAPELKGRLDEIQGCLDRLDFQQARELLPAVATALGVSLARGW